MLSSCRNEEKVDVEALSSPLDNRHSSFFWNGFTSMREPANGGKVFTDQEMSKKKSEKKKKKFKIK